MMDLIFFLMIFAAGMLTGAIISHGATENKIIDLEHEIFILKYGEKNEIDDLDETEANAARLHDWEIKRGEDNAS